MVTMNLKVQVIKEISYTVIYMQLQELNNHFSEAYTDLLLCMACLNPSNSFVAFALHLMKNIIGITNELSIALQKKKKNLSYSKCYGSCYSVKATITSNEG